MTDKIRLVTYVDELTVQKLKELCIKNKRTTSQQIYLIINDYLKNQ